VERNCVNNLGELHRLCGDYAKAEVCYQEALDLAQQLGDSRNIAAASLNLGDTYTALQHPDLALPLLDRTLETFRKLENRSSEANTLLALARTHLQLNQEKHAQALLDQATAGAEKLGDPLLLANAHLVAGSIHLAGRNFEAALRSFQSALAYGRKSNVPLVQAAAHQGIGDTLEATARLSVARTHWRRALVLYGPVHAQETAVLRARLGTPGTQ
jgi:tetratricopeptide (TPR) repeat protein